MRRIHFRRCLTIHSKGSIHKGMNKGITYLHFGGKGDHRKATTIFLISTHNTFRRTTIRMRGIPQMHLTTKKATRGRKGLTMNRNVLKGIIVGSGNIFPLIRGMFPRHTTNMKHRMRRNNKVKNKDHRSSKVFRNSHFLRFHRRTTSINTLLTSDRMGVMRKLIVQGLTFLHRAILFHLNGRNVRNGNNLPNNAIPSSRFTLTTTSKGRNIGKGSTHLSKRKGKLTKSSTKNSFFRQMVHFHLGQPFTIGEFSRHIRRPTRRKTTRKRKGGTSKALSHIPFLRLKVVPRGRNTGLVFFRIRHRPRRPTKRLCRFVRRSTTRSFGLNSTIPRKAGSTRIFLASKDHNFFCFYFRFLGCITRKGGSLIG